MAFFLLDASADMLTGKWADLPLIRLQAMTWRSIFTGQPKGRGNQLTCHDGELWSY